MQRYFERIARGALISSLAALHPFPMSTAIGKTTLHLQSIALLGGLAIALLGLLFVMGTLNWQRRLFQKFIAVFIFGLSIALISAIANVIQSEISGALDGNTWGLLLGGAVGGILLGCGGAAIQGIGKLSASRLALLGAVFITVGFFIEFFVIGIVFMM